MSYVVFLIKIIFRVHFCAYLKLRRKWNLCLCLVVATVDAGKTMTLIIFYVGSLEM